MANPISLIPPLRSQARSPSPVIPGAWPPTRPPTPGTPSLPHTRSVSCPMSPSSTSIPPNVQLHLDRVASFHQRLSLSFSDSQPSLTRPAASCDDILSTGHSILGNMFASEDSDLTQFTHSSTSSSLSQLADTSVSTTHTAECDPHNFASSEISLSVDDTSIATSNTHSSPPSIPLPLASGQNVFPAPSEVNHLALSKLFREHSAPRPRRPRIVVPSGQTQTTPPSPASPVSMKSTATTPTSPIVFASPSSSQRACLSSDPFPPSYGATPYGISESPAPSPSPSLSLMTCGHGLQRTITEMGFHQTPSDIPMRDRVEPLATFAPPTPTSFSQMTMDPGIGSVLTPLSVPWTLSSISLALSSPCSGDFASGKDKDKIPIPVLSVAPPMLTSDTSLLLSPSQSFHASELFCPLSAVPTTSPLFSPNSGALSLPASLAPRRGAFDGDDSNTSAREYATAVTSTAWGLIPDDHLTSCFEIEPIDTVVGNIAGHLDERYSLHGARVEHLPKERVPRASITEKLRRFGGRMKKILKGYREKRTDGLGVSGSMWKREEVCVDVDVDVDCLNDGNLAQVRRPIPSPGISPQEGTPCSSLATPTYFASVEAQGSLRYSQPGSATPSFREYSVDAKGKSKAQVPLSVEDREGQTQTPLHPQVSQNNKHRRFSFLPFSGGAAGSMPAMPTRPISNVLSSRHLVPVDARPRMGRGPMAVEIGGLLQDLPILPVGRGPSVRSTSGPPGLSVPPSTSALPENTQSRTTKSKNRRFTLSTISNLSDLLGPLQP